MKGRYLFLVSYQEKGESFTQGLCNLAVLGTKYIRSQDLLTKIWVVFGDEQTVIRVPHIISDPKIPVSNTLAIHIRQTSDLDVQISRSSTESIVKTSYLDEGTHELVIESYDDNSTTKGTLKIDKINISVVKVPEPEEVCMVWDFDTKVC